MRKWWGGESRVESLLLKIIGRLSSLEQKVSIVSDQQVQLNKSITDVVNASSREIQDVANLLKQLQGQQTPDLSSAISQLETTAGNLSTSSQSIETALTPPSTGGTSG